ncbi:structural protein [Cellulophaga phage phi38:1]|uniref:Structural protein n=1 Tax=Cellulophaga phage phi38:1 TaxID=1327977 RepID=R9ZYD3_9CAUD|nr:structural protein [Cellulophaga phage phi38:1]AGO48131.1 structural protein [Cellulophaga phage phi38:1]
MEEELDEFGIPVKKAQTSSGPTDPELDEFGIPLKKKEKGEPSGSSSIYGQALLSSDGSGYDGTEVPQTEAPDDIVDEPIAQLYSAYKEAGKIKSSELKQIEQVIQDQKDGKRSNWEVATAYAEGFLFKADMAPVFKFDTKDDLIKAKKEKNKINFLQDLTEDQLADLRSYSGEKISELENSNLNILFENKMMEERSKELVNKIKYLKSGVEKIEEVDPSQQQVLIDQYKEAYSELEGIKLSYNKNVDLIEEGTEDIGDFYEEINLLKRNYGGLDYYKDITRLQFAALGEGAATFALATDEILDKSIGFRPVTSGSSNPQEYRDEAKETLTKFRQEVGNQREGLRPQLSVSEINDLNTFSSWLGEQVASQLPVLATLAISGGSAGLGVLGAASGGQKIGELEDERTAAKEEISSLADLVETGTLSDEEFKDISDKIAKLDRSSKVSDQEMYFAGVGFGAFEILTERVSLGILSKGKRAYTAARRSGKIANLGSSLLRGTAAAGKEGSAEFVNAFAGNTLDIMYLDDPDTHVFDNTIDALASGAAMGFGMSVSPTAVGFGAKAFMPKAKRKGIIANTEKLSNILGEIENKKDEIAELETSENTSEVEGQKEVLKTLETKAKQVNKEISKDIKDTFDDIEGRSKTDIAELIELDKKSNGITARVKAIENSNILPELRQELLTDLKAEVEVLAAKKQEILDKPKPKKEKVVEKVVEEVVGEVVEESKENTTELEDVEVKPLTEQATKKLEAVKAKLVRLSNTKRGLTKNQALALKLIDSKLAGTNPIESLSEVDLSNTLGLAKAEAYLTKLSKELKNFGGATAGMNLPVVIAKSAVDAMRVGVAAAKTTADLLSIGLNHVKESDWFKGLNDVDQQAVIDNFESEMGDLDILTRKDRKSITRKLFSGVPLVSFIDEAVFSKMADVADRYVAQKIDEGAKSRNDLIRSAAKFAIGWANGLPRTNVELTQRRMVAGRQKLAYAKAAKMAEDLKVLINNDPESARRVHSVLDPELYSVQDGVLLEELTDNERALYDILRDINNQTHETNFALGLISKETYDKFKGNYIGRGYEGHETVGEPIESTIKNQILDDIYKERKDITEWMIDNAIQDPIYLTMNRMVQTERNAAVLAYSSLISKKKGSVLDKAEHDKLKDKNGKVKGYTLLTGKAYGKLDGKYVVDYVAEDFKGYFFNNKYADLAYKLAKYYDRNAVRQFLKKYHTVYSPVVQLGNLVSNTAFAFVTGINIGQMAYEAAGARKDLKSKSGDYLTLLEFGIIDSDILSGDLINSRAEAENLGVDNKATTAAKKAWEKVLKVDEFAQKMYSSSDDVMKLAAFKALKRVGYTEAEAVQKVFEGFQNYATVGKTWDLAAKTPLVGNAYIKFQADLQRIMKNAVTKRPLTTASFMFMLKGVALFTSTMLAGEEEEERLIREARPFIPKINLGFADIPLTFKVSEDKEVNVARFISPFYEYDIPTGSMLEKAGKFMPFQYKNTGMEEKGQESGSLDTPDLLLGPWYAAFFSNKDFRGKAITDPYATRYKESGLDDGEKLVNRLEYISRSQFPLFSPIQDAYLANEYGEDYFGRDKTLFDIIVSRVVKVQTYDNESLKKTIEGGYKTINYKQKEINDKMSSIQKKNSFDISEILRRADEGKISDEKAKRLVDSKLKEGRKAYNKQVKLLVEQQEELNLLMERTRKVYSSVK